MGLNGEFHSKTFLWKWKLHLNSTQLTKLKYSELQLCFPYTQQLQKFKVKCHHVLSLEYRTNILSHDKKTILPIRNHSLFGYLNMTLFSLKGKVHNFLSDLMKAKYIRINAHSRLNSLGLENIVLIQIWSSASLFWYQQVKHPKTAAFNMY